MRRENGGGKFAAQMAGRILMRLGADEKTLVRLWCLEPGASLSCRSRLFRM
jgi:hypothetical protein